MVQKSAETAVEGARKCNNSAKKIQNVQHCAKRKEKAKIFQCRFDSNCSD